MKKYIFSQLFARFLCMTMCMTTLTAMLLSPPSASAAAIYLGGTYAVGSTAQVDRQAYDTTMQEFTNSFGLGYKINSGAGYLFGIGGNNFAMEYRVNDTKIIPGEGAAAGRYTHTNIMLIGRSSVGTSRAKVGIGSGTATSPALGDAIIATNKVYRTSTYLLGYDFVPGGGNIENTQNGFFIEYQSVNARSGTFREVVVSDISVRETLRYNQFVFGYVYRFATSR